MIDGAFNFPSKSLSRVEFFVATRHGTDYRDIFTIRYNRVEQLIIQNIVEIHLFHSNVRYLRLHIIVIKNRIKFATPTE